MAIACHWQSSIPCTLPPQLHGLPDILCLPASSPRSIHRAMCHRSAGDRRLGSLFRTFDRALQLLDCQPLSGEIMQFIGSAELERSSSDSG
jgi:hypothetical protein